MFRSFFQHIGRSLHSGLLLLLIAVLAGCNATRHIPEGQYLLRSNSLNIKSDQSITRRGELNDQLASLVIQKPNTYFLGRLPYKIWLYNGRYRKYSKDTGAVNFQLKSKTVERPVIYDSTLRRRSALNMKNYLFNNGYFYAQVRDTAVFKRKKAYVTYRINTGTKYLVGKVYLQARDSQVNHFITAAMGDSKFKAGQPYTMAMAEEERSRIANLLRNNGYFNITQENVLFEVDTVNKEFLRNADNPFESAINFIALQRSRRNPTLDVKVIISDVGKATAFRRYRIGKVQIFPDFADRGDFRDSTMIQKVVDSVIFRYHKYYVRDKVLLSHNYLKVGDYYSQANYDQTIVKLNELGLFQYVQIYVREDTSLPADRSLRYAILLTPADRYDFSTNFEVSNGSNYVLGNNVSVTYRNRNWMRGGNQLALSLSAGVEMGYNGNQGNNFFENFYLISKNAGINSTITFPKFISPFKAAWTKKFNQPRTIVGIGYNLLDRLDYFTLNNVVASYSYNWRQNQTNTWDLTPSFVNLLRLPRISDTFQRRLDNNAFLANSYRENFIEGETISFTFSDINGKNARRGYSYLKLTLEEAGGLLSGINRIKAFGFDFSQYLKFDLDARHYFRRPHSTLALRFLGGLGMPYDKSLTLPYIKQYFVGGAYSIRGWRVRQLGPGSYYDSTAANSSNPIDRVGDVKFEANAEYRFDMVQLFSGAIHLNGALFADAGNIWLAKPSSNYPGGELALDKFGQDIAMSVGAGARLDIGGLFIIRLDAAVPVKKPYIHQNSGWIIKEVSQLDKSIFDKGWRNDNLVLNIAIGYPF